MPFWTVGDAGPYKENGNFLMRTSLCAVSFLMKVWIKPFQRLAGVFGQRPESPPQRRNDLDV